MIFKLFNFVQSLVYSTESGNPDCSLNGYFSILPTDVIRAIFGLLSLQDLCRLAIVNSYFKGISEDRYYWERLSRCYNYFTFHSFPSNPTKADFKRQWHKNNICIPNLKSANSYFADTIIGRMFAPSFKILVLGLDNAGKSTFFWKINATIPLSSSYPIERFTLKHTSFFTWDLGGLPHPHVRLENVDVKWHLQECVVIGGDGLQEGLDWLYNEIVAGS